MRGKRSWIEIVAAVVALACVWAIVPTATAQSKKSAKQAESLEKAGESAKQAVHDVLVSLGGLLTGYNAIIDGEAKDTQSAYSWSATSRGPRRRSRARRRNCPG